MRRRHFFGALVTAIAVPVAPHRVYSFLWDEPLVKPFTKADLREAFELIDSHPLKASRVIGRTMASYIYDKLRAEGQVRFMFPPRQI